MDDLDYNATYSIHFQNPIVDKIYGGIALTCFGFGLPANLLALTFFIRQQRNQKRGKDYTNILYMLIIVTDLMTCLLMLPHGLSYISGKC